MKLRIISFSFFAIFSNILIACPTNSSNNNVYLGAYTPISHLSEEEYDSKLQQWLTVAGPWYGDFERNKNLMLGAALVGLGISAYLPGPRELYDDSGYLLKSDERTNPLSSLSESKIRSAFQAQIERYLSDDRLANAVTLWALGTEELRPWVPEEMRLLRLAYEVVKKTDPQQRPVFMYEPNNRSSEQLKISGVNQDLLVRGVYLGKFGWNADRAEKLRNSLNQMRESLSDEEKPILPVLELSRDLPGYSAHDLNSSPEKQSQLRRLIRHDVFLALVEGARGIYIWSLYPKRPKLSTYHEQVAAYESAFVQIREYADFISNRDTDDVAYFVPTLSGTGSDDERSSEVSTAQFSRCGKRLLIVVNSSPNPVTGVLRNPTEQQDDKGTDEMISLEPFDVKLVIE